jgi:hypothetical protein
MPWLLLPVFGLLTRYCKFFCVAAHSLFSENNRACFIRLRSLLQKLPAQQWKILNSDSKSWNQSQIHVDRVVNPLSIDPALEGVDPNTCGLGLAASSFFRSVELSIMPFLPHPRLTIGDCTRARIPKSAGPV